jgi:hypothetical protein
MSGVNIVLGLGNDSFPNAVDSNNTGNDSVLGNANANYINGGNGSIVAAHAEGPCVFAQALLFPGFLRETL